MSVISIAANLSLSYYFQNTEKPIELANGVAIYPLYAHETCKIKVAPATNANIKNYRRKIRWDFGDGTIIEGYNAIHSYTTPGKYSISCTFYDSRNKPVINEVTIKVYVKEVIPTMLSVDHEYNMNPTQCRSTKLFEMGATLANTVTSEPHISARRTFEYGKAVELSYEEVKNDYRYHLKPYYTFLQEVAEYDFNNDMRWDNALKPVSEYNPQYHMIYGKFNSDLTWSFYALAADSLKRSFIKIFNPKSQTTIDYRGMDPALYQSTETINIVQNLSDVPFDAYPCGKVASFNVWYKTDNINIDDTSNDNNDLYFFFNQEELKFQNDLISDTFYTNIPPLGITISIRQASDSEIYPILSLNGFANNAWEDEYPYTESYLKRSFYKYISTPVILAYYIKNDEIGSVNNITYNMYKNINIVDALIQNGDLSAPLPVYSEESCNYYKSYDIVPELHAGWFKLALAKRELGEYKEWLELYATNNLISLDDIVLPTEHVIEEDCDALISCYTPHPLFDEADKFKRLFKSILTNNNTLNYLVSKGVNFIDDNVNHKTCYIDRLLSILESMGDQVVQYEPGLFKNINELRDLTRILSMNYSILFGNTFNDLYDLRFSSTDTGRNVGERLQENDVFYLGEGYEGEAPNYLIAVKRNGIIYPLVKPIKSFIIVEDYSGDTKFGSFETIDCPIELDYSDQGEEWNERNANLKSKISGAFTLGEYDDSWLWNLILPPDFNSSSERNKVIHRYYSFYLFNDNDSYIRKFNFIDEKTLPVTAGRQLSVEEWNDLYGFAYHCLTKVIKDKIQIK